MSKGNIKQVNKARTHQQAALIPESRPGHLRQSGSIVEGKREHTSRAAGTWSKDTALWTPEVAGPRGSQNKWGGARNSVAQRRPRAQR